MKLLKRYYFILMASLVLFFFSSTANAAMTAQQKKDQAIDILKHEIAVLQLLIKNIALSNASSYQISAKSYEALDINSGKVLLEKNVDQPQSIASITKLMNAVVAEENVNKNQTITLTNPMLDQEGQSPSLFAGLSISFENLLKASLIQSVNDAAQSISYFLGKDAFLEKMNQKAKSLSMNNTTYIDVDGLNLNNKSTARDLSKLVSYVYNSHQDLLDITKNNNFWLPRQDGELVKFENENSFYYLSDFIGGKTGYLPEARQSIASVFTVNGNPVAIVVLNSANREADTLAIVNTLEKK